MELPGSRKEMAVGGPGGANISIGAPSFGRVGGIPYATGDCLPTPVSALPLLLRTRCRGVDRNAPSQSYSPTTLENERSPYWMAHFGL